MEEKLTKLRGGVTLVSPEERKVIEALYTSTISQWRKRKRMFKDIWDSITENSPKNLKEFKVLCQLSPFLLNTTLQLLLSFSKASGWLYLSGRTWN